MKLIVMFVLLWRAMAGWRAPPEVYVLSQDTNIESNIRLTCLATGFSFHDIIMWIKRDGRKLYREDGLRSSGVRPNEDGTFQRRDSVEILRKDKSKYTCEVIHEASSVYVTREWENPDSGSVGPIIGAAVGVVLVLVLVAVVLVVLYKKGIIGCKKDKRSSGNNSNNNARLPTVAADNRTDEDNNGTNRRPEAGSLLQNGNKHRRGSI